MGKIIIHSDLNNFFASVECLKKPWLKDIPMAVAGDSEMRHGIILAKNALAAKDGVKTAEPIWAAKRKCPSLITVPPNHEDYVIISKKVRRIYEEYSDKIEAFGIDECWLDISDIAKNHVEGKIIADEIREKIKKDIGITASCGVSFNKIFAKLGSDIKKPDATTVISEENFKETVWPLSVDRLLFVGHSTLKTLNSMNIRTIGDLANSDVSALEFTLGKHGVSLWTSANGNDNAPVSNVNIPTTVKSVGNSITLPYDITDKENIRAVLLSLCEKVSERLRKLDFVCSTVHLWIRDHNLNSYERQTTLSFPNRTAACLFETVFKLYEQNHKTNIPIRAIGVRTSNLTNSSSEQLTILPLPDRFEKFERKEKITDDIRRQFGKAALKRGVMLTANVISDIELHEEE